MRFRRVQSSIHGKFRCTLLVRRTIPMLVAIACMVEVSSCSGVNRPYASITSDSVQVLLVPQSEVSGVGWCIVVVGPGWNVVQSSCPSGPSSIPIFNEDWGEGSSPPIARGYALTSPRVAAVSVDGGPPVDTQSYPTLPDGLRTVAVEIRGLRRQLLGRPLRFTPLNATGKPIRRVKNLGPRLAVEVPVRPLPNPAHPTAGACHIETAPLAGLKVQGGNVVTHVASYRGLLGHPYLTCVSIAYNFDGWPTTASVLLDASDPGVRPRPLPGMRSVSRHPGIFEAPGVDGAMIARRITYGWLTVAGAGGVQQRLALLEHLHAAVHL